MITTTRKAMITTDLNLKRHDMPAKQFGTALLRY